MKVSLRFVLDFLLSSGQEVILVVDGMTMKGRVADLSAMLCADVLCARVTSIGSYDVNVLQVIAAMEETQPK